jgi:hypothetical protein
MLKQNPALLPRLLRASTPVQPRHALAAGSVVEERFRNVDGAIPSARSPHPDKETDPTGIHSK